MVDGELMKEVLAGEFSPAKHEVEIEQTIRYRVRIEAASELEARRKVQQLIDESGGEDLDADEIDNTEFKLVEPLTGWNPESHWDEHPEHSSEIWQLDVDHGDTRQSYVEWVNSQIELAKEDT